MKSGLIIQHCFSTDDFSDAMRLTHMRHSMYARAFNFDFWAIYGDLMTHLPQWRRGGWGKIELIRRGLEQGYQDIVWIDADAAIVNGKVDLRDAMKDTTGNIGAVLHDAPWFHKPEWNIPRHYNTGVMYFRQSPQALEFVTEWGSTYEEAIKGRWLEQGEFNRLIAEERYSGLFVEVPAKWNATVNVNPAPDEVIRGWHGVQPYARRLAMMKETLADDWYKFRV